MVGALIFYDERIIPTPSYPKKEFKAGLMGTDAYTKDLFEHPEKFMNKMVTVQYFSKSKFNRPRFPKAKCVRDYE